MEPTQSRINPGPSMRRRKQRQGINRRSLVVQPISAKATSGPLDHAFVQLLADHIKRLLTQEQLVIKNGVIHLKSPDGEGRVDGHSPSS